MENRRHNRTLNQNREGRTKSLGGRGSPSKLSFGPVDKVTWLQSNFVNNLIRFHSFFRLSILQWSCGVSKVNEVLEL
jgi:hypothetical protein